MEKNYFENIDLNNYWLGHTFADTARNHLEPFPDDTEIAEVEAQLGYKLPESYIYMMRKQNGGYLKLSAFPTTKAGGWAEDHILIDSFAAIGSSKLYSLCGPLGDAFWKSDWEYPDIGIYIGHTPSAGHQMIALDYRACGKKGEPAVVQVDQESDYEIVHLADNFEAFILQLEDAADYVEDPEIEKQETIQRLTHADFSPIVLRAFAELEEEFADAPIWLRKLGIKITEEKGYFALHADPSSRLMNDFIFWLYCKIKLPTTFQNYLKGDSHQQQSYDNPSWVLMIAAHLVNDIRYDFKIGGYSEGFVQTWWKDAIKAGDIIYNGKVYQPSNQFNTRLIKELKALG